MNVFHGRCEAFSPITPAQVCKPRDGVESKMGNCCNELKLNSIFSSHPIKIFATNKTSPDEASQFSNFRTNDIDRIKASASLIQATVGRIQLNKFKRLDIL
jgi:hypothetical protein